MTTYPPTATYPIDVHVEHNGVPTNGRPQTTIPTETHHAPRDTPENDPFYYGTRTLIEYDEHGKEVFRYVPLSLADFLNPQEGDHFMQGGLHAIHVGKLTSIFRYRYRHIPTTLVCTDKKILWGIKGLSEPAPDVAIIPNVLNEQDPYQSSFDVQAEGTRPYFVMEVVSPRYRDTDLYDKVDLYARAGVEEYFILNSYFDRKTGKIVYEVIGYRLQGMQYVRIQPDKDGLIYSATNDVLIGVNEQGDRFFVLDGQTLEEILPDDERAEIEAIARLQAEQEADEAKRKVDEIARKLEDSERRAEEAEQRIFATARNLLPILDNAAISQATGLSVDEVRKLREQVTGDKG